MTIEQRLITAAKQKLQESKIYAELEKLSGIKATSWRAVAGERQRATSEMLEWACQQWPQYAFWIATGETATEDLKHTTPEADRLTKTVVDWAITLQKEPKDWTADEVIALVTLWNKGKLSKEDALAVSIGLEAREAQQTIKTYVQNKVKKITKQLTDSDKWAGEQNDLPETEEDVHTPQLSHLDEAGHELTELEQYAANFEKNKTLAKKAVK